jgi:hypothetical protein
MSWLRLMEERITEHEPSPPGKRPHRVRKLISEMWPAYQRLATDNEFSNNVLLRVNTRKELLDGYQNAAGLGAQLKAVLSSKIDE